MHVCTVYSLRTPAFKYGIISVRNPSSTYMACIAILYIERNALDLQSMREVVLVLQHASVGEEVQPVEKESPLGVLPFQIVDRVLNDRNGGFFRHRRNVFVVFVPFVRVSSNISRLLGITVR